VGGSGDGGGGGLQQAFELLYWPYCYSFPCLCGPQFKSGSDTRYLFPPLAKKRLPVGPVIVVCHNNASGVCASGFVAHCVYVTLFWLFVRMTSH